MQFEIFFDDLRAGVRSSLLDFYGIDDPKEMNWDVYPIATIELDGMNESIEHPMVGHTKEGILTKFEEDKNFIKLNVLRIGKELDKLQHNEYKYSDETISKHFWETMDLIQDFVYKYMDEFNLVDEDSFYDKYLPDMLETLNSYEQIYKNLTGKNI